MRLALSLILTTLLAPVVTAGDDAERPIWLAVTRPAYLEALAPLAGHRRAEGLDARIVTTSVVEALAGLSHPPAYLLLVGDDEDGVTDAPWAIPAPRRDLYRWRLPQRKEFAADALLGDLDGDLDPDLPVGRIPARSAEDVARVVAKILAHERRTPTEADLGLVVWGGAPGYGARMDAMATGLLVSTVQKHAPNWVTPWMISAGSGQPLCGWPPDHTANFTAALRRGGVLAAVLAHASEDRVVSMKHDGRTVVLSAETIGDAFDAGPPSPPMVLLTCNTGRFSRGRASLSESILLLPGGPVAVIGATTESHPLTNYFSGMSVLRALDLDAGHRRLGDLWLDAQRRAYEARDPLMEVMLRDVEGKLEEDIDVPKLRRDQRLMYAILGDPATRLSIPGRLEAAVERTESGWNWTAERPAGATALHVSHRALGWPSTVPAKGAIEASAAREAFGAANEKFVYRPLSSPREGAPWEGVVGEKGRLRLLATGPGVFRVVVLRLE